MTWPGTYQSGHQGKLIQSGEPYFRELFQLIRSAKEWIHVQTYIFDEDATGKEVLEALWQASARGVKVYLVTDGYGTKFSHVTIERLKKSEIFYRSFSPIRWMRVGKRLHHKVVITDEGKALIGGINFADKYRGNVKEKPWLDFAVLLQGPVCDEVRLVCERLWQRKFIRLHFKKDVYKAKSSTGNLAVALSVNNWYRGKLQISAAHRQIIRQAKSELLIVGSYFLPGTGIRKDLTEAAARGVKITILLSGISDVPLVNRATRYLYDWLCKNNINIYEWKESVLHGKLMLVDGVWTTIGSYNINRLSDYGSIEMNVHIDDRKFAEDTEAVITGLLTSGAQLVNWKTYESEKSFWKWAGNVFSYYLVRLSLKLFLWLSEDKRKRFNI